MIFPTFLRRLMLLCGDILLYYLALIITLIIRFGGNLSYDLILKHLIPFSYLLPIWIGLLSLLDGYDLKTLKSKQVLIIKLIILCSVSALLSGLFFYIFTFFGITPKTNLIIFSFFFGIFLFLERRIIVRIFANFLKKTILFIGDSPEAQSLIQSINKDPQFGWQSLGFLNEDNLNELQKAQADIIVIVQENLLDKQNNEFFHKLFPLKSNFIDLPTAYEMILKRVPINSVNPKWFLANFKEGKMVVYDKLKRLFDFFFGLIVFLITLPLWPFISLAIKSEDGNSILYIQKRMGKNFKPYTNYKFRTMKKDSDQIPWTEGNKDPRITKVGNILRRIHIDELPQMINIIKGDLSFVGPRPENLNTIIFLEKQIPFYHLRHLIKPGFTGWAQVALADAREIDRLTCKADKTKYDFQKIEHDLYYIKNRSMLFDLLIIAKTMDVILKRNKD